MRMVPSDELVLEFLKDLCSHTMPKWFRSERYCIGRSANKAAHSLTMMALLNFNYIDWDTALNFLVDILQFDACASDSS
ncbi:hypothetical protein Goshw_010350, partial [Gossypium schwendimanii]|nr:hypothetical protein [Gossypium schwendimanii]